MMRGQGLAAVLAAGVLAGCMPQGQQDIPSGAADFATFCAGCHGADGTGNSDVAATMNPRPADLTKLSANNGGVFPTTKVMAQIWGYKGKKGEGIMPNFGELMDADNVTLVLYDGGDGIETPTPVRLVQVAEYLKAIQVK